MDSATFGPVGDCVKSNRTLLGGQLLLGLDALVELNETLGDGLAKELEQKLAFVFSDVVNLGLVIILLRLILLGLVLLSLVLLGIVLFGIALLGIVLFVIRLRLRLLGGVVGTVTQNLLAS